jgi:hypothetical protein
MAVLAGNFQKQLLYTNLFLPIIKIIFVILLFKQNGNLASLNKLEIVLR